MSFRRERDDWDDFRKRHADAIQRSGVPREVVTDKLRFLVFLEHGYDEWGWAENPHDYFHPSSLTDDQIEALAELVGDHIDESYRDTIASRWQRR